MLGGFKCVKRANLYKRCNIVIEGSKNSLSNQINLVILN